LISPFSGLLFDRTRVGSLARVTAPPYDTISPEEHRRYVDASPHNIVRIDLGTEHATDVEANTKYRRAAKELRIWREDSILIEAAGPAYFPYEMRFSLHGRPRRLRGLICSVELEPWGGSIVPHERTMQAPVEDRLSMTREVRANLSCIQAVFFGPFAPLGELFDRCSDEEPVADVLDELGVEHRMWATPKDAGLAAWLAGRSILIADGHHRYETALRYQDEMGSERGPGPWDRTMMLLVDGVSEEPPVLPYHRVLRTRSLRQGGDRVRDLQEVLDEVDDEQLTFGVATREDGELVHLVARLHGSPPTVSALHESVLDGLDDDLWFTPDAVEAEEAVRDGRARIAFFLPATAATSIRSVIDRGDTLPQKSTYFWPKPRTGMVIRPLDDAR
jgi:uncharacterized protein (DUF1015 family)